MVKVRGKGERNKTEWGRQNRRIHIRGEKDHNNRPASLECRINMRRGISRSRLKRVTNIDGFSKVVFDPIGVPEIDALRLRARVIT
ncbi:hypothetical protein YC2023_120268 [Brassica napus]